MPNELKWLMVTICVLFGGMFTAVSFEKWSDNQTKIACYEAAKTNQSLKCEGKKQ